MKVDGKGNLWFSLEDSIGYFNPFSKRSYYFKKNYDGGSIQQIAFHKGKVYGMIKNRGFFVLQKSGKWLLNHEDISISSIATFTSNDKYPFVKKNRKGVHFF